MKENKRKVKKLINDSVPMKRFGSIEEIFDLCLFLCSKKNFSTGATFILDGGQTKSFN